MSNVILVTYASCTGSTVGVVEDGALVDVLAHTGSHGRLSAQRILDDLQTQP